MKSLIYKGPNRLEITDVPKPLPKPGEVLVKIKACGICGSDVHGYTGSTGRRIAPMVMGHEFSGVVEAPGDGALKFPVGSRVIVQPVKFCGDCEFCRIGYTHVCPNKLFFGVMSFDGAFQEYLCVPEKLLYPLPDEVSFEEGALVEALAVSFCGVKKAGDLTGKDVLIVGGGTIGQLALMATKVGNPRTITLSDLSNSRLATAKMLGADYVINPGEESFNEALINLIPGGKVDVAFEAVGVGQTVAQAMSVLKPQGTCVWIGNSAKMVEVDMQAVVTQEFRIFGTYIYTHEEFGETIEFMAKHKLDFSPIITKTIPIERAPELFEELVTEVEKYLKVVVVFE